MTTQRGADFFINTRLQLCSRNHSARHSGQYLKRTLSGLIETLATQNPHALLRTALGKLGKQSTLAATRLRFQQYQPSLSGLNAFQLRRQNPQLMPASHEGRLRQRLPPIEQSDDKRRLGLATIQRFRNHVEVTDHGFG